MYSGKVYSFKEVAMKIVFILSIPALLMIIISTTLKIMGIRNIDEAFIFMLFQVLSYVAFLSLNNRFRGFISDKLKLSLRPVLAYVLAGLALFTLSSIFILGFGFGSDESQRESLKLDELNQVFNVKNIFMILSIIIIIPFYEELLFRGLLFTTVLNKFGFKWALIVSSVIFGLLHSDLFILTTIYGLIFNYIYFKTNSLIPGIVLHMVWNALVVLL
ncbi:CPBP family intramembrane glutamic endopeptidase [Paenibacillus xylanexedens]|uniref:CPBP family intramembrane glutamic endopeptidase n=1 Tax=Paenibacillus xylanexedens TaxID=528191 RepID=UPI0011A247C1|nr:type II CAAX endopeptidase family protein [Paenibacillus xylanexedens]